MIDSLATEQVRLEKINDSYWLFIKDDLDVGEYPIYGQLVGEDG